MPRCSQCGTEVEPEAVSCSKCGAAVSSTASFQPVGGEAEEGAPRLEAVEGPALVVRKGPQPGEIFFLDGTRYVLGRDPVSDIFLNDMTVSRAHAVLSIEPGKVTVHDEKSLNGTYVNGVCVDEAILRDGDVLQIGTFQMVYHGEAGDR